MKTIQSWFVAVMVFVTVATSSVRATDNEVSDGFIRITHEASKLRLTAPKNPAAITKADFELCLTDRKVCDSVLPSPTAGFNSFWVLSNLKTTKADGTPASFTSFKLTPTCQTSWVVRGTPGSNSSGIASTTFTSVTAQDIYFKAKQFVFNDIGSPTVYVKPQQAGDTYSVTVGYTVVYKLSGTTVLRTLTTTTQVVTLTISGPSQVSSSLPSPFPQPYTLQERHSEEVIKVFADHIEFTTSQLNESWAANQNNSIEWTSDLVNWEPLPYTSFSRDFSELVWTFTAPRKTLPNGSLADRVYFRFKY